jgi:hypothetical protein
MFHLNERTLEKLVSGSAPVSDVERIRYHVRECRSCAHRLEEWRDNYAEVDHAYPELAHTDSATTVTAGGMVVVPESEERRWKLPQLNFANLLWILALVMALVVGYGANRLRSANDGFEAVASARARPLRPETGTGAGVPMPLASPSDSLIRLNQKAPAPVVEPTEVAVESREQSVAAAPPAAAPSPVKAPPPPARLPRSTPAMTIDTRADPPPPPAAVTPRFRSVPATEAVRRLGGALRLLQGIDADHIEIGPAAAVPGATAGLAVVRVVYRTADGGRMLLDQQLLSMDSSGGRPVDDRALERGEVAFGTAPNGVSVATWQDQTGYRISLVAQAPIDSLKRLIPLVQ